MKIWIMLLVLILAQTVAPKKFPIKQKIAQQFGEMN